MKPTADRVLVEADKPKTETDTGILLQEEWKTLPPTGTVIAIGPEVKNFKEGDRIVFERYGAIKVQGPKKEDYRLCKASHVLAVLDA